MRFNPPPNWPPPPPGWRPDEGWRPDPYWPPPPPGWPLWVSEPRGQRGVIAAAVVAIGALTAAALTIALVASTGSTQSGDLNEVAAQIECKARSLAERAVCRDIRRNFAAVFAGDVEGAKSFICRRDVDDGLNQRLLSLLEEKGAGARAEQRLKSGRHQLAITDIKVHGRTATATVNQTIALEAGSSRIDRLTLPPAEWSLLREDGTWKLCRGS